MRKLLAISLLSSALFLLGCLISPSSNIYANYSNLTYSDYCNGSGNCTLLVCHNTTVPWYLAILPDWLVPESSLKGGNCSFITGNGTEIVSFLNGTHGTRFGDPRNHTVRFFFLGQGPDYYNFDNANLYCNNSLSLVVRWLMVKPTDTEAPRLEPDRVECELEHNVMTAYIYYSGGQKIRADWAENISKTLNETGPVILVAEANYSADPATVDKVKAQVRAFNESCPKCLIAVMPANNDSAALDMTFNETDILEIVDIVGQGIDLQTSPDCKVTTPFLNALLFSKETLHNYSKPTIWFYVNGYPGPNRANTCNWTNNSLADAYQTLMGNLPSLVSGGTIGMSLCRFTKGSRVSDNPFCPRQAYVAALDSSGSLVQMQPYFNAWFEGCQDYFADSESRSTIMVMFPEFGKGPACNFAGNLNMFKRRALVLGATPTYSTTPVPEYAPNAYTCFHRTGNGTFPASLYPYVSIGSGDYHCADEEFDALDQYADLYDLDPVLVRAIAATESSFNPWAMSCVNTSTCPKCKTAVYTRNINRGDYEPDPASFATLTTLAGGSQYTCGGSEPCSCAYGLMQCIEYPGDQYLPGDIPDPIAECGAADYNPFNASDSVCCGTGKLMNDFLPLAEQDIAAFSPSCSHSSLYPAGDNEMRDWVVTSFSLLHYHGDSANHVLELYDYYACDLYDAYYADPTAYADWASWLEPCLQASRSGNVVRFLLQCNPDLSTVPPGSTRVESVKSAHDYVWSVLRNYRGIEHDCPEYGQGEYYNWP